MLLRMLNLHTYVAQEKRVAVAERLLERELARERKVAVVVPPLTAFVG